MSSENPWISRAIGLLLLLGCSSYICTFSGLDRPYFDEHRFIGYAYNLLEGSYAVKGDCFLWNGPGLPIVIAPLLALKLPLVYMRLLNVLFLTCTYFILVRLFRKMDLSNMVAISLSLLIVLFPSVFEWTKYFYTEILCLNLIALFVFCLVNFDDRNIYLMGAALSACFLMLTKIIFFYVFLSLLPILFFFYLKKDAGLSKALVKLFGFSFLMFLPYLIYNYSQTNRFPYVGNAGGLQLYGMTVSSPNHTGQWREFPGDWNPYPAHSKYKWPFAKKRSIKKNWYYKRNQELVKEWVKLGPIEADDLLKREAFSNIISSPGIYLKNIGYNVSRLFFDVPRRQTGFPAIKNALNLIFVFGLGYILLNLRLIIKDRDPISMFLFCFLFSYLAASSLLSAYSRFFIITFPIILFLVVFVNKKKAASQ